LKESLTKHIIPALTYQSSKEELNILDICFGIGYNTLATLYYMKKHNITKKVNIYSPEFNLELIQGLKNFNYPTQFEGFRQIIEAVSTSLHYEDDNIKIEVYNGDAREYIKNLSNINIVYQDAFSSDVNKMLWTKEYFEDISRCLDDDAIITTYSIATPVRLSMWENGLNIYEIEKEGINKSTIALNKKEPDPRYKYIDMDLKKQRNKAASALYDKD
jgi:tRNA U34 5-methylaminomethyl-2-thiouridine-forming methyltransferase MnmC